MSLVQKSIIAATLTIEFVLAVVIRPIWMVDAGKASGVSTLQKLDLPHLPLDWSFSVAWAWTSIPGTWTPPEGEEMLMVYADKFWYGSLLGVAIAGLLGTLFVPQIQSAIGTVKETI